MKRHRIIHTTLALLAFLPALCTPSPALALEPIPQDVTAFLESSKPSIMEFERDHTSIMLPLSEEAAEPDIRAAQKTYYVSYDDGDRLTIVPSDEWTAAVYHGTTPTGTATAWRDEDGTLTDGQSTDAQLAQYLTQAEDSGSDLVLIHEEHAWFLRKDGMMTPLNEAATQRFPTAVSEQDFLDTLQPIFDETRRLTREAEARGEILVGGGYTQRADHKQTPARLAAAAAILLLPCAAAILVITIRRKRPHGGPRQ
ncbi:hypothetical protein [Bifidobacterium cuniculi]|uniref:Uncharacterized protein n=1 Tax=Bifidobacterium cuniculi TaxID=1688 RepID=A0A087ATI1_9BIFI|nr:hypothetical protein [Bifidobacterium cuniculi]KFI62081.1 hypothetical protein BCUN_1397 [Bifidobacterium cuniculi]